MTTAVAYIPELIEKIALFCGQDTRVKLLLTCRSFFAAVAPLIWRKIKGIEKLLCLIQGVTINPISRTYRLVTLPEPLSSVVLQRFRLYASFVLSLDLFSTTFQAISNWEGLFDLSLSSPLLPNLLEFTAGVPPHHYRNGNQPPPYLLMFLSPSLVRYRVPYIPRGPSEMITEPPFVEILSALQQRCPNLEALKLFRASCSNNSEGYISLVPRTFTVSEYFRTANLRFLSTSLSVFNELDDLGDLGLVSQVERLEILSSQYGHSPSEVPSFHGVEWPNLRYLSLYLSYDIDLFCYLWAAPSLVASLTSFKLQIKDLLAGGADDKAETVASLLAERSPKLKEVAFYGPPPEQLRSRFDPAPLIRMLPKLPVQKLQVDVRGVEATPPCLSQRLSGQIFPSIQSLDVGSYGVELGELESLAMNLPNLTYLRIKIGISGNEGGEVARPTSGEQAFELRVSYLTLDSLEQGKTWEDASKYLLSLWPHMCLQLGHRVLSQYREWVRVFSRVRAERISNMTSS